jgi:flagellar biosynthetic protein FliR
MAWLEQAGLEKFLLFALVLTRTSGLMMTLPAFGTSDIPIQIRASLAVALALVITPTQWAVTIVYPGCLANFLVLVGGELLIGFTLGLGVVVLFSGIQLAGETIGRTSGEMAADVLDPTSGESVPVFSQLLYSLTVAMFLCLGGHRIVVGALLDTFQSLPPGQAILPDGLVSTLVTLVWQSFALGIRSAAPVVAALLLSNVVLGLIGRTLPQLNILALGFGFNSLVTYGVLAMSLGGAVWIFQDQLAPTIQRVAEVFVKR